MKAVPAFQKWSCCCQLACGNSLRAKIWLGSRYLVQARRRFTSSDEVTLAMLESPLSSESLDLASVLETGRTPNQLWLLPGGDFSRLRGVSSHNTSVQHVLANAANSLSVWKRNTWSDQLWKDANAARPFLSWRLWSQC